LLDAPVMWREQRVSGANGESAGVAVPAEGAESGTLANLMQATSFQPVVAHRLPTQRLLLPKGASVDCTLQTAIDSTLPGLTTCITAVDVFGADGRVVLLERGTTLVGETKSDIKQGQARVFVIWTEARTPTGVIIPLGSPGTDALGRAGLAGGYDTHFGERFGAAILVSVIDGAIQAGVNAERGSSGSNVVIDPQGSRDVLTEVLKKTISIAPTITVNQGARVAVLVARDVDFRSVYALRVNP
jgi:type IV secretion system protein VirB10